VLLSAERADHSVRVEQLLPSEAIPDRFSFVSGAQLALRQISSGFRTLRLPRLPPSGKENPMNKRIYVGNLPFSSTEVSLRDLFAEHGDVVGATIVTDRETGRSRGFGFVEMSTGGEEAISVLNGRSVDGRSLTVNEARPRNNR